MYANNRFGKSPRAKFRSAGGSKYYFGHPFLTGQLSTDVQGPSNNYEVDISSGFKLNDQFFDAEPLQDASVTEVAVDGSLIVVTNSVMAGTATLQVLPGDGTVAGGDLTAIAPFIVSSGDTLGGYLRRVRQVNGKAITRVYYDVTFKQFPHDKDSGNSVPVYPITISYGGWIEGIALSSDDVIKALWSVGAARGWKGSFKQATEPVVGVGADEHPEYDNVNAGATGLASDTSELKNADASYDNTGATPDASVFST
jgi:hypothetical protein